MKWKEQLCVIDINDARIVIVSGRDSIRDQHMNAAVRSHHVFHFDTAAK